MFYLYILKSIYYGKYYIGQTENIEKRMMEHNSGKVNFTSRYIPWELELCINKASRKEAIILERKLKNLNREDLEEFITKYR